MSTIAFTSSTIIRLLVALSCVLASCCALDGSSTMQTAASTGLALGMNRYLPAKYDHPTNASRRYPLWVFLGGAGEHGDPNDPGTIYNISTRWGPARETRYNDRDYPFIVVTPVGYQSYISVPDQVHALIEYLKANLRVDPDRIVLSGLCTGAGGVMEYGQLYPQQLAAIFPIITQSPPWKASRLAMIPSWLFHAYGDSSVPRSHTITWANGIANASLSAPIDCMATYPYGTTSGGSQTYNAVHQTAAFRPDTGWTWTSGVLPQADSLLMFTMYSSSAHQVWQETITNPTVLHWAFKQRRQKAFRGTPSSLPGRVQAEDFDLGGHLRAYRDSTAGNDGGNPYRVTANPYDDTGDDEQVDLATGGDGVVLTGTAAGEWLTYSANCADSGSYTLRLRISATLPGGSIHCESGGTAITGPISIPVTTGYTTIEVPGVNLPVGPLVLRMVIDRGGFNLDWFEFSLPAGPADLVIDNRQADKVTTAGPWTLASYTPGFYASDYLSVSPGIVASATFRTALPRDGYYEVFVRHPSNPARGIATVTVASGDGHSTFTALVDQRANGGAWFSLGTFNFVSVGSVTIDSTGSVGYISADAVRFAERDAVPLADLIVDNLDGARVVTSGPWGLSDYTPGFYAANYLSAAQGSNCVATFRPNLTQSGMYEVYMRYPANASRGISPVTIAYDGGSYATTVDQRQNGGSWVLLGTFPFIAGPDGAVTISSFAASGYVSADAVRFTQVTTVPPLNLIIDNDDASRVTAIGAWSATTTAPSFYGANYISAAPDISKRVVYRPNLPHAGTFGIFIWYPMTPTRGTTPVTIAYGDGSLSEVINVDQRTNGGQWNLLGTFPIDAGSGPTITIGSFATGGWIGADAVRLVEIVAGDPG